MIVGNKWVIYIVCSTAVAFSPTLSWRPTVVIHFEDLLHSSVPYRSHLQVNFSIGLVEYRWFSSPACVVDEDGEVCLGNGKCCGPGKVLTHAFSYRYNLLSIPPNHPGSCSNILSREIALQGFFATLPVPNSFKISSISLWKCRRMVTAVLPVKVIQEMFTR